MACFCKQTQGLCFVEQSEKTNGKAGEKFVKCAPCCSLWQRVSVVGCVCTNLQFISRLDYVLVSRR